MWKLKEFAEGATRAENARKFKERLEACSSLVEGQGLFEVGIAQGALIARTTSSWFRSSMI